MNDTSISWTHGYQNRRGRTWNPTNGCKVCSAGCANCYAMRMAGRFSGKGKPYQGLVTIGKNKRAIWNGKGRLAIDRLVMPLRWKQPSLVFVNSMSDLHYEGFSFEEIAAVYGIMVLATHHVFQVLTKRAKRRREWYAWVAAEAKRTGVTVAVYCVKAAIDALERAGRRRDAERVIAWARVVHHPLVPFPNVWEGVSVENQDAADERIPDLLETPAAVRFLSCEPLLGPVDLHAIQIPGERAGLRFSALQRQHDDRFGSSDTVIDWVIAGCESGPGARPCDVAWLRALRDQCASPGTAFFLKQAKSTLEDTYQLNNVARPSHLRAGARFAITGGQDARKKSGGVFELPYLDGRQHKSFPEVTYAHAC